MLIICICDVLICFKTNHEIAVVSDVTN